MPLSERTNPKSELTHCLDSSFYTHNERRASKHCVYEHLDDTEVKLVMTWPNAIDCDVTRRLLHAVILQRRWAVTDSTTDNRNRYR